MTPAGDPDRAAIAVLLAPARTALITVEVQDGVVGEHSVVPSLAASAEPILPRIAALAASARAAGVTVIHCTVDARGDGKGASHNARVFGVGGRREGIARSGAFHRGTVHAAIGATDADLVMARLHGASPMAGTSLDPVLRNLGVTTVVATGVSVNVAVLGLTFEAVNLGYHVVIPRDAVAGVDADYVDAVFARTLSLLATITTVDDVVTAWAEAGI